MVMVVNNFHHQIMGKIRFGLSPSYDMEQTIKRREGRDVMFHGCKARRSNLLVSLWRQARHPRTQVVCCPSTQILSSQLRPDQSTLMRLGCLFPKKYSLRNKWTQESANSIQPFFLLLFFLLEMMMNKWPRASLPFITVSKKQQGG